MALVEHSISGRGRWRIRSGADSGGERAQFADRVARFEVARHGRVDAHDYVASGERGEGRVIVSIAGELFDGRDREGEHRVPFTCLMRRLCM